MSIEKIINKRTNNISGRLLTALAFSLISAGASVAQPKQGEPKLVIGIMVDDLQSEYVELLRDHFGQDGFNRLLSNGVLIANADYGSSLDTEAATAVIFTGAAPCINGIPAGEVYDRTLMRGANVMHDPSTPGTFTSQSLSPAALAVTTIGDEAKISARGLSYVYSISPSAAQAVIMSGHIGNASMWLNDANLCWATSTYYKEPPTTIEMRNRLNSLRSRIDTMVWTPSKPVEAYPLLPKSSMKYPFKHTLKSFGSDRNRVFRNSPKANDEVTAFAIENIEKLKLGQHEGVDMLNVAYTLRPFAYGKSTDARYELMDSYYRLDQNLAQLFQAVDKEVGIDNAVIFVAATPPASRTRREDQRWQLPYGEFSTEKAISLLNLYLIAKYGNGNWVCGYHNGQLFLNTKEIEHKRVSVEEMRTECARFLERMSGVAKAITIDEIIDAKTIANEQLRQNLSLSQAGDVLIQVMPGWQIVDDFNSANRTEKVERMASTYAPVYIMAPGVARRTIDTPVDARSIAPTVTRLLRIRSPNGASSPALIL